MSALEGSNRPVEGSRGLPHLPNLMVIGLTESPDHRPSIGITFEGKAWLHLTTKQAPLVATLRRQLKEAFNVDSIEAGGFDRGQSLEQRKLVLLQDKGAQGVFVPAEEYDRLVERIGENQL